MKALQLAPLALHITAAAAAAAVTPQSDGGYDVAVYGATPAGVMAAVAAARMYRRVVLMAAGTHIGGMVSGGLSHTDIIRPADIDNRLLVGGVAREFFDLNTAWYAGSGHGAAAAAADTDAMIWDVEPHVAATLFRQMLGAANVTVILNATVATAAVSDAVIHSIRDRSGREFGASMWVDATYEGDLLASAGVSYVIGRESAAEYNESAAGFTGGSSPQFGSYVDPYDGSGTLLPLVDSLSPDLAVGDADTAISSYTFRLCITDRPDNQVPFEPPPRYNRSDWELFLRHSVGVGGGIGGDAVVGLSPPLPGGRSKHDLNGEDFVGTMHGSLPAAAWAEANATTRAMMWQQHKDYVQGHIWFAHTELGFLKGFGLCKDEFVDNGHWPPQLYVREARRMKGERVVVQRDIDGMQEEEDIGAESVGIGGYVFDTHTARQYACTPGSPPGRAAQCTAPGHAGDAPPGTPGYAWKESHMVSDPGLFQLPRHFLLPRREEATNLVVPGAVSASHVVFSCIRMEPQWMVLGHAAGVLAALALGPAHSNNTLEAQPVQDVPAARLNAALRSQGAKLDLQAVPKQTSSCVLNRCVPNFANASGHSGCQFCKRLAANEWLAPTKDFAETDPTSANVTAVRAAFLQKTITRDVNQSVRVSPGWYAWQPDWDFANTSMTAKAAPSYTCSAGALMKRCLAHSTDLPPADVQCFKPGVTRHYLNNTKITDAGLRALAENCKGLTEIDLADTKITDAGLRALAKNCKGLTDIDLSFTKITDAAIIALAENCKGLADVDLSCTNITDAGLRALAENCKGLAQINLRSTNTTDADVRAFKEALPGCRVLAFGPR
eukprot:g1147.t1